MVWPSHDVELHIFNTRTIIHTFARCIDLESLEDVVCPWNYRCVHLERYASQTGGRAQMGTRWAQVVNRDALL